MSYFLTLFLMGTTLQVTAGVAAYRDDQPGSEGFVGTPSPEGVPCDESFPVEGISAAAASASQAVRREGEEQRFSEPQKRHQESDHQGSTGYAAHLQYMLNGTQEKLSELQNMYESFKATALAEKEKAVAEKERFIGDFDKKRKSYVEQIHALEKKLEDFSLKNQEAIAQNQRSEEEKKELRQSLEKKFQKTLAAKDLEVQALRKQLADFDAQKEKQQNVLKRIQELEKALTERNGNLKELQKINLQLEEVVSAQGKDLVSRDKAIQRLEEERKKQRAEEEGFPEKIESLERLLECSKRLDREERGKFQKLKHDLETQISLQQNKIAFLNERISQLEGLNYRDLMEALSIVNIEKDRLARDVWVFERDLDLLKHHLGEEVFNRVTLRALPGRFAKAG